ncbi:hypothetical protein NX059_001429 [Plenodomus lindquistii]|nr:hypothetical protein NX059_001429 [Plenodomus lindquistii]
MRSLLITSVLLSLSAGAPHMNRLPPSIPCPATGIPGGVYLCPLPNFQPSPTKPCEWRAPGQGLRAPDQGTCTSWGSAADARSQSIGPDMGTTCVLYASLDCSGVAVHPWVEGLKRADQ